MAPDATLKSKENLNPSVTSGAFKMSESVPGNHYTVVRNDNYYLASQGMPYLDRVVFRPVSGQNTVLKDLQANNATSTWFIDVSKTRAYQALSNYNFVGNAQPYITGLGISRLVTRWLSSKVQVFWLLMCLCYASSGYISRDVGKL